MDLRIETLENPKSLSVRTETPSKKFQQINRLLCFITCVLAGIVIGIMIGSSAATHAVGEATPSPEPKQMTSKLEISSAAMLSMLDVVEEAQSQQVKPVWDVPLSDEEMVVLLDSCKAAHIDPAIALGLIQVESSFNPDALNAKSGCYGYCQLNPLYFPAELSPVENIQTGIEYLAYQLERYDNLEAALTAYNAGHDTGSRTYAAKVLEAAAAFERR